MSIRISHHATPPPAKADLPGLKHCEKTGSEAACLSNAIVDFSSRQPRVTPLPQIPQRGDERIHFFASVVKGK